MEERVTRRTAMRQELGVRGAWEGVAIRLGLVGVLVVGTQGGGELKRAVAASPPSTLTFPTTLTD